MKILAASCLMMTLLACAPSSRLKAGIGLPEMPASLKRACPDPGVRAGHNALIDLARNRKALATCSKRHRGSVRFYGNVKKEIEG